jgi:hypothetical protein
MGSSETPPKQPVQQPPRLSALTHTATEEGSATEASINAASVKLFSRNPLRK